MSIPNKDDHLNWGGLLSVSRLHLGISPGEFWKMTFAEYWPLHESLLGRAEAKQEKLSSDDLKELNKKWGQVGKLRRISS